MILWLTDYWSTYRVQLAPLCFGIDICPLGKQQPTKHTLTLFGGANHPADADACGTVSGRIKGEGSGAPL